MNRHSSVSTLSQRPGLTFQPNTYQWIVSGINDVVNAVKPTLGPSPHLVAVEQPNRNNQPELLDNGALIARRITQLSDVKMDMGAMLVRHMLWKLYEQVGDGSATAAIIYQRIVTQGIRYITSGGNGQQLRSHLIEGLEIILAQLRSKTLPISDHARLSQFVESISHDQKLTDILIEIFSTLGVYARIDLRSGYNQTYERTYVEGILWEGGLASPTMILDRIGQKTELEHVAIFVSDFELNEPSDVLPIIDGAAYKHRGLVVVAKSVSEKVIGLLNYINTQDKPFKVIAVKLPDDDIEQQEMLDNLVHTVGGRAIKTILADQLSSVCEADLGYAEKIWANQDYLCVVDTNRAEQRSDYLLQLEKQYKRAKPSEKKRFLRQIGQLMGASATVFVGGFNKEHIHRNKEQLENMIKVVRSAYENGLISGGGSALVHCQDALRASLALAASPDERAAFRILIEAVESPTQAILENRGYQPGLYLEKIRNKKHYALDADGQFQCADAPLILDAADVVIRAIDTAIRTAALTLSVDVLVHHRNPEFSATP